MFGFILIFPAAVFIVIAYFAVSKRSSPPVRRAAIITLIILALAVIICLILIINHPTEGPDFSPAVISRKAPEKQTAIDWRTLIAVILVLLGIILTAILRDRRKSLKKRPDPSP
jgi:drug/metabolite transporter (DMT)-like permease